MFSPPQKPITAKGPEERSVQFTVDEQFVIIRRFCSDRLAGSEVYVVQ